MVAHKVAITFVLVRVTIGVESTGSLIRKHGISAQIASNGEIEITDGVADPKQKQAANLAHGISVDATDDTSPMRKRAFSIPPNGDAEISDGVVDSTHKQSSSLVRHVMPTTGDAEILDGLTDSTRKHSPSLVRHVMPTTGDAEISDGLADSTHKQSSSLVRRMGFDAKGNLETGADNRGNAMASEKSLEMMLRSNATGVHESVGQFGNVANSKKVHLLFGCFFGIIIGVLAAAAFANQDELRDRWEKFMKSTESWTKRSTAVSEDDSDASDDEPVDIRTAAEGGFESFVVRTGVLWKLRKRFIEDLRSHRGSDFLHTDRFAYLESWDLRYCSLDVDVDKVLCSYVSDLTEFNSVVFEIKSIDDNIVKIPAYQTDDDHAASRRTEGAVIDLYNDYLDRLRQIGYELPDLGHQDPTKLYCIVMRGKQKGEKDGSRSMGRLKFQTVQSDDDQKKEKEDEEDDSDLSSFVLGGPDRKECKRWHGEISHLLTKLNVSKAGRYKRSKTPPARHATPSLPDSVGQRRQPSQSSLKSGGLTPDQRRDLTHVSSFARDVETSQSLRR